MRHSLAFAAALLSVTVPAAALTLEAKVRAPRGALMDGKIEDSYRLSCKLLDGCEKAVYIPDDATGFTGRAVFKGLHFRPELTQAQRDALLRQLDAIWGEPVAFEEDLPGMVIRRAGSDTRPRIDLSKSLPSLIPDTLSDGSSAAAAFDGSAARGAGLSGPSASVAGGTGGGSASAAPGLTPAQRQGQPGAVPVPAVEAGDAQSGAKPGPYARQIAAAAARYGLEPRMLTAVVQAKSGFHADAGGGGATGAHGLMGVSRRSFRALEAADQDILDPEANLDAGARMLSGLLKQFDGDTHRALAAYQAGPRAVLRSGGIPNQREVHRFLAAYELAYRKGDAKPAVIPAKPPTIVRRAKDAVQEALVGELDEQRPSDDAGETADTPVRKPKPLPRTGVERYRSLIEEAAKRAGVDPRLMEAMVMRESSGDPNARSSKGAQGLGQLMPGTARMLGVKDPTDPKQNLRGMAAHLDYLLDKYDNPVIAVAAYNAGERRVERAGWLVPHISETRAYVRRVFRNYEELTGDKVDVESYFAPARRKRR